MPNTVVNSETWLHVVAAVIYGLDGKILLSKRLSHQHQGDKWEFPGGKLEQGETPQQGLARELAEELEIQANPEAMQPLIQIRHRYPEKNILLDVWEVHEFQGQANGAEGQEVAWFEKQQLSELTFPDANRPIITAVQLPKKLLVTPELLLDDTSFDLFIAQLESSLKQGVNLVQLRTKSLSKAQWHALAERAITCCHAYQAKLLLNTPYEHSLGQGVHLTSQQLLQSTQKPDVACGEYVSASVHNLDELLKANELGLDFILLSPVQNTQSHPDAPVLGWDQFHELCKHATMPVYALGGMQEADIEQVCSKGGQGIAAISSLWNTN